MVCVCHQKPPENANALIAHLTYNNVKDVFAINNDNSIDEIPIILSVNLPKFKHLPPKEMMIFPDSRASICIAALQHMHTLGLLPSNLIPCYKQIKAAGGSILICKGWVSITFNIATFKPPNKYTSVKQSVEFILEKPTVSQLKSYHPHFHSQ